MWLHSTLKWKVDKEIKGKIQYTSWSQLAKSKWVLTKHLIKNIQLFIIHKKTFVRFETFNNRLQKDACLRWFKMFDMGMCFTCKKSKTYWRHYMT